MTTTTISVEDFLWLLLAGAVPLLLPPIDDGVWGWEAWVQLGTSIGSLFFYPDKKNKNVPTKDAMGVTMGIVVIPVILQVLAYNHACGNANNWQRQTQTQMQHCWTCCWATYAKMATLLVIPGSNRTLSMIILCTILAVLLLDPSIKKTTAGLFVMSWCMLIPRIVKMNCAAKSFTAGELKVVCLLLLIAFAEYARMMSAALLLVLYNNYDGDDDNNYDTKRMISSLWPIVALSGSVSCCVCAYLSSNVRGVVSWGWRLWLNVVGPPCLVAMSLHLLHLATSAHYNNSNNTFSPMIAIQWLINFLMEKENGHERFWGLLYWIVVLVAASYPTYALLLLAKADPSTTTNTKTNTNEKEKYHKHKPPSVVVTRKWFHLVAVFLFGPVTWQFPQLMSLSYAIAACILVVLEVMRGDNTPLLQAFYAAFLDEGKHEGVGDGHQTMIVSHLFLVVGCAVPLWMSQVLAASSNTNGDTLQLQPSSLLLLGEFGVVCVGIGDAMGAVVGKRWGRHKWGSNQRTLEGSLAMWLSMVVATIVIGSRSGSNWRECGAFLGATTLTTVLEAFTVQLDNLVLPMFGSCVAVVLLLLEAAASSS